VYAETLRDTHIDVLQGLDPRMLHRGDLKDLFERLGDAKAFWGREAPAFRRGSVRRLAVAHLFDQLLWTYALRKATCWISGG